MENFERVGLLRFLRHINSPMVPSEPLPHETEWDLTGLGKWIRLVQLGGNHSSRF